MSYCKAGDKPTIDYQFNNGSKRVYKSDFAPIDVTVKEAPKYIDADKYDNEGFQINYVITDRNQPRSTIVIAYDVKLFPEFGGYWGLIRVPCGGNPAILSTFTGGVAIYPDSITVDKSVKCPVASNKKCTIEVKHKGIIIYSDQGNCPCNFTIKCGNCNDNEQECKSNKYPGYCCIPCQGTASKINNLAAKVRAK